METTTLPFVTEDMTLVTVLKMRGIEPAALSKSNGGCRWSYSPTRTLEEIVDEYNSEECYVEPKEFSRKLGLVRTEMYRYLGVSPRRVRS
jgi:hypothetical protein